MSLIIDAPFHKTAAAPNVNPDASPRWLIPKFLTSALALAFLLILLLDASIISLDDIQHTNSSRFQSYLVSPIINNNNDSGRGVSSKLQKGQTLITKSQNGTSNWVSTSLPENYTSTLLSRWLAPGGEPCRDSQTSAITIPELDKGLTSLSAGEVHTFSIQALDESGNERCLGGDYFEADISGGSWKSRPPITDHGNGSYSLRLQIHPLFAGNYTFTLVLLFRGFQGLKLSPVRFSYRTELRKVTLSFYRSSNVPALPELKVCKGHDFLTDHLVWSGRWTRHAKTDEHCGIDDYGRYRCLDFSFPCQRPWCEGPLGALESNGWVYSAHCSFRLFVSDSAWKCLNNKWLFFWGDSNHVDSIRNLLNFVLGLTDVSSVPRRFDMTFSNPRNESESVRITSIFNGHWNDTNNYLGLRSLKSGYFRELLWKYFLEDRAPDVMIFNSGLHDGVYWKSIRAFADGAEYAAKFWEEILHHVKKRGFAAPKIFYRTTIATGGYARDLAFNPSKMEAFNGVMLDKLKERGLITGGVVDEFDMTFPWHYDNRCNDGVHYGRAPAKAKWRDGEIGHQYFVDLMLVHVLLNAICNE